MTARSGFAFRRPAAHAHYSNIPSRHLRGSRILSLYIVVRTVNRQPFFKDPGPDKQRRSSKSTWHVTRHFGGGDV